MGRGHKLSGPTVIIIEIFPWCSRFFCGVYVYIYYVDLYVFLDFFCVCFLDLSVWFTRGFNVKCVRIFCAEIDYECWVVRFVLIWWRTWSSRLVEEEEQCSYEEIMKSKKQKRLRFKKKSLFVFYIYEVIVLFIKMLPWMLIWHF